MFRLRDHNKVFKGRLDSQVALIQLNITLLEVKQPANLQSTPMLIYPKLAYVTVTSFLTLMDSGKVEIFFNWGVRLFTNPLKCM